MTASHGWPRRTAMRPPRTPRDGRDDRAGRQGCRRSGPRRRCRAERLPEPPARRRPNVRIRSLSVPDPGSTSWSSGSDMFANCSAGNVTPPGRESDTGQDSLPPVGRRLDSWRRERGLRSDRHRDDDRPPSARAGKPPIGAGQPAIRRRTASPAHRVRERNGNANSDPCAYAHGRPARYTAALRAIRGTVPRENSPERRLRLHLQTDRRFDIRVDMDGHGVLAELAD